MTGPIHFRSILLRRMPGFPRGAFELEELSPGVNLVVGPNASGKTTTARALQTILWPELARPPVDLRAAFRAGDSEWVVEVEGDRVRRRRDGHPAEPPTLPPAESRPHYDLSLQTLLGGTDRPLAAEILLQSQGGYDVEGAARELGFRTAHRKPAEVRALERARDVLSSVAGAEEELRKAEERLRARESEREQVALGLEELRRVEALRSWLEARKEVGSARVAVGAFPGGMARLREDDGERLREARRKRGMEWENAERCREKADQARRALGESGIPAEGVPESLRPELRRQVTRLDGLTRTLEEGERALAAARERRAEAERRLAPTRREAGGEGAGPLAALDTDALERVADLLRRREEAGRRRDLLEERTRALGAGGDPEIRPVLEESVRSLREWLRSAEGEDRRGRDRRAFIWVAVLLSFGGALAALLLPGQADEWGIRLLLAVAPLLAAGAAGGALLSDLRARSEAAGRRERIRQRIQEAGEESPGEWEPNAVTALLERMERRLEELRRREREAEERERLARELREAELRVRELEEEREAMAEEIGLPPGRDDLTFHWLAEALRSWSEADAGVRELEGRCRKAFDDRAEVGARIVALLEPYRPGTEAIGAADTQALPAEVEAFYVRAEAHARALEDLEAAEQGARDARVRAKEAEEEYRRIAERLGLDEEVAESEVERWGSELERFRGARKALEEAAVRERDCGEAARATGWAEEDVDSADPGELDARRRRLEEAAARAPALDEEIGGLRERLARAREKHDREDALAGLREAGRALAARRDRDMEEAVGALLARWVQDRTRDHARPAVFLRARDLFARLTHGRYRLDLDDGEGGAFRALDTVSGEGRALDELSDGTRVQLLLSVRMAFVERQEGAVALPLFLDEVLANADDRRAPAVMEAVAELARQGRQVFYFTAQEDEVVRWRRALGEAGDVRWTLLDLERIRAGGVPGRPALPPSPPARSAPPAPDGLDHGAYGEALGVPPPDLRAGAGAIHLWYLTEDPRALHAFLGLGLERWGQLEHFVERAGEEALGKGREPFPSVRALAAGLEAYLEGVRRGRGRPVDRGALVDSGAVTDRFLDEVDDLRRSVGRDATRLLAALSDGRVRGFQSRKRDELEEYFREEGYLDPSDPLPAEDLRVRALARARSRAPDLFPASVDGLLRRLAHPPSPDGR